jgi:hypothetical protein
MIGELLAAFNTFLKFGVEAGAISAEEAESLLRRCKDALVDSAERQVVHQAAADPVDRYLSLLQAVLASGRGHIAAVDGTVPGPPHDPNAWGWDRADDGRWSEQGRRIGWVDGNDLLLDPESSFAEANRLASDQGESLSVTLNTLLKRLEERHLLVTTDPRRHTSRWKTEGVRRRVLHLRATTLTEGGPSGPSGPDVENEPENKVPNGPVSGTPFPTDTKNRPSEAGQNHRENGGNGPHGPHGPHGALSHTDGTSLGASADSCRSVEDGAIQAREVFKL